MAGFDHETLPGRVIFGRGSLARVPEFAAELGASRVLVVATASQARRAAQLQKALGKAGAAAFARAAMHTPVEVTEDAMRVVEAEAIDALVAIGGGSAIGLGKAIAFRTDLPQIVIPTTYAGSEMTPVLGQTEAGAKTTQRSARVLPEVVIYDVDLTLSLPPQVSVTSGFNAMAHAVEALYAREPNRLLSAAAQECVRAMAGALPKIVVAPGDVEARAQALEAAWLGGWCLAAGGSALHHRLCHVLGGAFGLPHAETHTVLLPHVLAFNVKAAPDAVGRLCDALDAAHPADVLFDLAQSLGGPLSLKALGMPRAGIDRVAATVLEAPPWNPRPPDGKGLKRLLARAWRGDRPH